MVDSVITGRHRADFLNAVESKASSVFAEGSAALDFGVDAGWAYLNNMILTAAHSFFEAKTRKHQHRPDDARHALDLRQQCRLALVRGRLDSPLQPGRDLGDTRDAVSSPPVPWHLILELVQSHHLSQCSVVHNREVHVSLCVLKVKWATKLGHKLTRREDRREQKACLEAEVLQYLWDRNFAMFWRLARQLNGNNIGRKKRRYGIPRLTRPSSEQWRAHMQLPGPQGGCSGTPIDWEATLSHAESAGDGPLPDFTSPELVDLAEEDLDHDSNIVWKMPLRKAVPSWCAPLEIWRMVLKPQETHRQVKNLGLGAKIDCPVLPCFRGLLQVLFFDFANVLKSPSYGTTVKD